MPVEEETTVNDDTQTSAVAEQVDDEVVAEPQDDTTTVETDAVPASDGQVNEDVLELIHKSEAWLEREVKAAGYNGINDVFLGEYIDGQLRLTGYSK
ncbi:hypothetical protein GDZ32_01950 [Lactobacillus helveticus]|uniref:YetF C-terminal domain-containing protein n=1 Tax=Lactobacillus helveticus TaxID=1587 RepID=A0A6A7JZS1_LACHE|nr:YetF domain-containing protein [Lactobacillus helveticus]MPW13823.1 hypothetical protein [Lactobacillus helveticus]